MCCAFTTIASSPEDSRMLYRGFQSCIVIVLHNHPSLSDFSLSDVQFLLRYASVKMMVVVTNLGSISYLVKGKAYVYEKAVTLSQESERLAKSRGLFF